MGFREDNFLDDAARYNFRDYPWRREIVELARYDPIIQYALTMIESGACSWERALAGVVSQFWVLCRADRSKKASDLPDV